MLRKKLCLFCAVVGTAILLLSLMTYLRFREKERATLFFAEIPDVILKDVEGKPTELRSGFANRPTCIVYIDAGCRYCKDQIKDIEEKIDMLKDISLGYDFPKGRIAAWNLSALSLRLNAANPFLIFADKKLNGQDPEFINSGGVAAPIPRQYTLTLRVGL